MNASLQHIYPHFNWQRNAFEERNNHLSPKKTIMAPIEPPAREIEQLVEELIEYRVGAYERFDDARDGEMDGFRLNIVLFGFSGSGKSSLINTIFECLGTGTRPAVIESSGREGTKILKAFDLPNCVTIYDTRAFFDISRMEEGTRSFTPKSLYFATKIHYVVFNPAW